MCALAAYIHGSISLLSRRVYARRHLVLDEEEDNEGARYEDEFEDDGLPRPEDEVEDDDGEMLEDEMGRRGFVSLSAWLGGDRTA